MKFLFLNSIHKKLSLLIMLAVLPALVILLYSGIEQRRHAIKDAKQDVLLLTHTMAEAQKEITRSTKHILSTLSLLPAIQSLDHQATTKLFGAVLEKNPNYSNIVLVDLTGEVLASGKSFSKTNLADRKHIRESIDKKDFAVGEYLISRAADEYPVFAFAYPVLDNQGRLKAVLATAIRLTGFAQFHDFSTLPEKSFVALTDHKGIRLLYYPSQKTTNPVGKAIKATSWKMASNAKGPGILTNTGSDGLRRIFAFEQVRLTPEDDPYLYVWAGIPEAHILATANASLTRNLLLMLLASGIALFLSWVIGKKTLLSPIQSLVNLTRKFAEGNLEDRSESITNPDEFGILANAFHDMADTLSRNQSIKNDLIEKLQNKIDEVRTLRGIIPICSFCKKIRNDKGYWDQVEVYVKHHSHADFSHSFCPECAKKHYPEFLEEDKNTRKFAYEIKPDQNLILSHCKGVSSLEYIIKCCDKVYSDPLFRRGMNDIIDLSHAYVNIDYDQVKQLGEYMKNIEKDRGECRIAVVTNDGPVFGVIHCLKTFTEDSIIHISPFKAYEEAMAWVTVS